MTVEEFVNSWGMIYGEESIDDLREQCLSDLRSVIRGELIRFGNTITSKKFPYAVCHGNEKPFATAKDDFSVEYVVNEFQNNNQ